MKRYVYALDYIDGVLSLILTEETYWNQHRCAQDWHIAESDPPMETFLEQHGFYEAVESTFENEDITLEQAKQLIENDPHFVDDPSFKQFVDGSE